MKADKTEYVLGGKEHEPDIAIGKCVPVEFTATLAHGSTPTGTVTLLDRLDSTTEKALEVTQLHIRDRPPDDVPHGHGCT